MRQQHSGWPLYHPKKTGVSVGHSIFLTFSLGKINGAILPTGRFAAEKAGWRVSRAQVVTAPAKPLDYYFTVPLTSIANSYLPCKFVLLLYLYNYLVYC